MLKLFGIDLENLGRDLTIVEYIFIFFIADLISASIISGDIFGTILGLVMYFFLELILSQEKGE